MAIKLNTQVEHPRITAPSGTRATIENLKRGEHYLSSDLTCVARVIYLDKVFVVFMSSIGFKVYRLKNFLEAFPYRATPKELEFMFNRNPHDYQSLILHMDMDR